jgi:tRNA pseudouridine55 synthase
MKFRRGASGLSGILIVDKPAGITSHDVVNAVRRATGEQRVGHAGTLDPLATGVLVVLVGPATRLEPYLSGHDKTYVPPSHSAR